MTPTKWVRIWNERLPDVPLALVQSPAAEASGLLRSGDADAGFVRLPVDRTYFSAIPLYTETTVVVVPKDHLVTAADEVSPEDLADEIVLHPLDDVLGWEHPPGRPALERPVTTADAVELVAAGVGLLVVPKSLARLHHRKDLTYRPLSDVPESGVALAWPEERTTDLVDDLIGIVRGRTVNSTRGRSATAAQQDRKRQGKDDGQEKGDARRKPPAGKQSAGKQARKGARSGSGSPNGGGARAGGRRSGGSKAARRGRPRGRS